MSTKFTRTVVACAVAATLIVGCGGKEERKAAYMERGKIYFEENNIDKAKVEFKNVLQIDPKTAEAHYYIGRLAEQEQEWAKAFGSYNKAVELDPAFSEARVKLGQFYLLQAGAEKSRGDEDGAENAINKAKEQVDALLKQNPDDLDALVLQASIDARQGRSDLAISSLEKILKQDASRSNAVVLLARLYETNGSIDRAREKLESAVAQNPDDIGLRTQLVQFYNRQKDSDAAVAQMRELIRLRPEMLDYRVALAAQYMQSGNTDQAEAVLREAIAADETDPKRYLTLVQFLASQKGVEAAIAELKSTIDKYGDMMELRFGLAQLYQESGDAAKAKEVLQGVIAHERTEPKGLQARVRLAELYGNEGNYTEVRRLAGEVLKENPKDNQALLLKGRLDLQEGKLDEAVAAFRSILKDQPDAVPVLMMLAQAHMNKGETELAGDQLRRAVEIAPQDTTARLSYARFLLAKGDQAGAAGQVDAVLSANPSDTQALGAQADLLFAKRDLSGVKGVLEKLKQASPDSPEGNLRMAKLLLTEQDLDGALREADAALAKDPSNFGAMIIKSDVLASRNDADALQKILQLMQEAYPDSPEGYFRMGRVYRAAGKQDMALSEYEKALERASGPGEVQMLKEIIETEMALGAADKAEARLKAILDQDAKHPVAHDLLGMVYLNQKRFPEAEAAFSEQIKVNPNSSTVYSQLASARIAQENLAAAAAAYEDGLKVMPDDLRLQIGLAGVEEQRGNYTHAMDIYGQVLSKVPDNALATNNLAALLADHGEDAQSLEKAKSLAAKLAQLPQPAFQDTVGWVHFKAGEYDQAVKVLKTVVEQAPQVPIFQYHLGMASYKQGDSAAAKTHLAKALELGEFSGMEQAREVLEKLP